MRTTLFVLALLVLPALATAQRGQSERHNGRPADQRDQRDQPDQRDRAAEQRTRPAVPPPMPGSIGSIGLPLPSIGLPLPSIGIQAVPGVTFQNQGQRDHRVYSPGYARRSRPQVVYVVPPYYAYGNSYTSTEANPPPSGVTVFTPEPLTGTLRLEVDPPGRWQLLVDGVFYGTADDLGSEVELPPGSRRIELRAPGYQSLVFDVRIEVDRTVTYRGRLDSVVRETRPAPPPNADTPAPAPKPVVPTGSKTLYLIPGCYLGNILPQKDRLRDGCDLSSMKTITP